MKMILKCKLTCLTAPDTLLALPKDSERCYLKKDIDYFVCGMGEHFAVTEFENAKMYAVNNFSNTFLAVMLDTQTGEYKQLKIIILFNYIILFIFILFFSLCLCFTIAT